MGTALPRKIFPQAASNPHLDDDGSSSFYNYSIADTTT